LRQAGFLFLTRPKPRFLVILLHLQAPHWRDWGLNPYGAQAVRKKLQRRRPRRRLGQHKAAGADDIFGRGGPNMAERYRLFLLFVDIVIIIEVHLKVLKPGRWHSICSFSICLARVEARERVNLYPRCKYTRWREQVPTPPSPRSCHCTDV